ncbi:MAG TPA: helix-hairpin-helix domain-containing protein [Verrucomicrobiae bacterium]|nr:helix-hairpin-helix domain-containing protein [Verrucomicrobiae bacterium]
MRLPFFRSSKTDTTKITVAEPVHPPTPRVTTPQSNPPPTPTTSRTSLQMAETQLMSHPLNNPRNTGSPSPATPDAGGRPGLPTNGQTIPLSLSSISQQLPGNFLATVGTENVRRTTVNIPTEWILPQLARGRVTVTLAELIKLLPEELVRRPLPAANNQHAIVLPLAEIVSGLPADLLQPQNQTEVDLNTPEYTQFPNLVDEVTETPSAESTPADQEAAPASEPAIEEPAAVEPVPAATAETSAVVAQDTPVTHEPSQSVAEEEPTRSLASHMATPIPPAGATPTQASSSPVTSGTSEGITVSLRSLVAVMPDQYFICPRTDLWRRIDLDMRIPLPSDLVVPQLKIARVRLPMSVAVGLMPRSILASPLPSISDETIPIALQEIVPQLPPNIFASQTKQSDLHEIDFSDSDIPTPFAEKNFTPATVEIRAPEPIQLPPPPAPAQPEATETSSNALEDESVSIFAEKSAVSEPPAAEAAHEDEIELPAVTPTAEVEQPVAEEPSAVEPGDEPAPSLDEGPEEPMFAEVPKTAEPTAIAAESAAPAPAAIEPPVAEPAITELAAEVTTPASIAPEQPVPAEPQPTTGQPASQEDEGAEADEFETAAEEAPAEIAREVRVSEPPSPVPHVGSTPDQVLANLNRWSLADLARIESIGPVLAKRIIEFRDTHGGFKSIDDLHQIPGISRRLFHSLASPPRRQLNRLLGVEHNDELTLQEIVRLTSQMKGMAGCILAMSDGVFLTGELPGQLDRETISVFAPQLFRKVGRYMRELRAGRVTRLSVFTDQQPISIFSAGDIFLIVLHDNRHFSKALLRKCERISQELARLCRQRTVE